MEISHATDILSALAQETRLEIFRHLVRQGPDGLAAGDIGAALSLAPATLSFHLNSLRHAGLVVARREGRQIFYAVRYETISELMGFLVENCCQGHPEACAFMQQDPVAHCG